MTDKEMAALIRKTTKAVGQKRGNKDHEQAERADLARQEQVRKNTVDIGGEKDLLIADAPADDLFRMMAKRDF